MTEDTTASFSVAGIEVRGSLIMAPMAGYSDSPTRTIARRHGSAMSYTEFVNAIDILHDLSRVLPLLKFNSEERPVVFQIFDNDPDRILRAAQLLLPMQPDILDINLGCSARSVSNRGAGAGLLRKPALIARIFHDLTSTLPIPVTAKIRLGWDAEHKNYLEVARILEENGASLLAVHGRTRQQAYSGRSDWDAIAEIKQAVTIPVIANGDVRTPADIQRIKQLTGCDGVMIGRGSYGNPWIFENRERDTVSLYETKSVMLEHLSLMRSFFGEEWGVVLFRKHLKAYLSPYPLDRRMLQLLLVEKDVINVIQSIQGIGPVVHNADPLT